MVDALTFFLVTHGTTVLLTAFLFVVGDVGEV